MVGVEGMFSIPFKTDKLSLNYECTLLKTIVTYNISILVQLLNIL